jgi:2,4-dienoyl-CoA reductase-like NADH-dependent reductase (Old Yellow Enzyme family)
MLNVTYVSSREKMPSVFDPLIINKLVLENRFVRSATMDSMGKDGFVTEPEIELYKELGRGEIGLVISHGLYPTKEGQCSPGQLGVHSNESTKPLSQLVKAVHQGGGKIAAQILHGGWMCNPKVTGLQPVGPSEILHPSSGLKIRQISSSEIYELIDDYAKAAVRIIDAGFDAIQLHGAHSWLLSAFLSPVTNQRQDKWGGSLENRVRFIREIYNGIRKISGHDFPLLIKLGLKDYHPQGKSIFEGIEVAKLLQQDGFDAIEVSEGLEKDFFHHIRREATSPYYLEECGQAKKTLSLPLVLVGGMRKFKDIQKVLEGNIADAISMCRPFINNPYLVRDFKKGILSSSVCNSCNECLAQMGKGKLRCVLS